MSLTDSGSPSAWWSFEQQAGGVLPEPPVLVGLLGGDVNGDGAGNQTDAYLARRATGSSANTSNFHLDVDLSGTLSESDGYAIRLRNGRTLPC